MADPVIIGVDLGGTQIRAARLTRQLDILEVHKHALGCFWAQVHRHFPSLNRTNRGLEHHVELLRV